MKDLTIQPQKEGKGRSFRATLVAHVEIRAVSERGNDAKRPVFMAVAGTDNELRPFVANLRTGKKAEHGYKGRERYEILKSAGFQCTWQRSAKGTLATLFAPDLFCLDPGMVDPKGVQFCLMPDERWTKPSEIEVPDFVPADRADDVRRLAPLFIAYLDRRTRCPLIPDPRFYVQVLANALSEGLAVFPSTSVYSYRRDWGESGGFSAEGLEELGMHVPVFFDAKHDVLEEFLARQVKTFFEGEMPESRKKEEAWLVSNP